MNNILKFGCVLLILSTMFISGCNKGKTEVTFNPSNETVIDTKVVEKDGYVEEPMDPVNGIYLFDGWYANSEYTQKWDFAKDKVKSDMALYAKWIERYLVNYYVDGSVVRSSKVKKGDKAEFMDNVKPSSTTLGWYTDEALTQKYDFDKSSVTGTLNLYGKVVLKASWEFPADLKLGWYIHTDTTGFNPGTITESEDCIKVAFTNPSDWSTHLRSPNLDISTKGITKIKIVYKNLSANTNLRVFYFRTTDENWDGKGENFPILVPNMKETDDWKTIEIIISDTKVLKNLWNGNLLFLRFEFNPIEPPCQGNTVWIKSISLE